jgi:hypothetical protein
MSLPYLTSTGPSIAGVRGLLSLIAITRGFLYDPAQLFAGAFANHAAVVTDNGVYI